MDVIEARTYYMWLTDMFREVSTILVKERTASDDEDQSVRLVKSVAIPKSHEGLPNRRSTHCNFLQKPQYVIAKTDVGR